MNDSDDEHASVGEEDDVEDELLEAEGPVLHDSDDDMDCSNVPTHVWKSGNGLDVEPNGTFKQFPMFIDIAGPNVGQVPPEFTEIQLFFSLFPLDLVDMTVDETNRYAMEKREKVLVECESSRKWTPLDRHSFMRFLGVSIGMVLQYMPNKTYYWKEEKCHVLRSLDYASKMGQT